MRIGIFGGSFDPIHNGHMHMAVSAYRTFQLDEVWLIPAGHSPNKKERLMTPAAERLSMCELAVREDDHLRTSSIEMDASEKSYTYRTLEKLTAQHPSDKFFFLMGGDSLDYFDRWKKPERICALATILVVPRDRFDTAALEEKIEKIRRLFPCDIRIVPCSQYPISSTELRRAVREGTAKPSDFPQGVLDYIKEKHLYLERTKV